MTELLRVIEVTACPETGQVIEDKGDTGMRVTREFWETLMRHHAEEYHLDVQDADGEDEAVWMRWVLPVVVYLPHGTPAQVVEAVEEHLDWLQKYEPDWCLVDVVIDFDDHLWVDRADEVAGAGLLAWVQQIMGEAA